MSQASTYPLGTSGAVGNKFLGVDATGAVKTFTTETVVRPDGIPTDGATDASASIISAVSRIVANNGGVLDIPYCPAGYVFTSTVVIDPGLYANGSAIKVRLNGNTITGPTSGWCFDVRTNFFGANNGYKLGTKIVSIDGGGAVILGSSTGSGGVILTDVVGCLVRDMAVRGYTTGDAFRLYASVGGFSGSSTWCEHNQFINLSGSGNLNGIYTKSTTDGTAASYLGNTYENCAFEGTVNNAVLFNLEGSHVASKFDRCGGYYNQNGKTGGKGFYLNGWYPGATFINPWIDAGGGGTQSALTDIVFGPLYTASINYQPTFINTFWIVLPSNWRQNILLPGPFMPTLTTVSGNEREVLRSNRTYYVNASTGSDSNSGLATGSAFATIAQALTTIYQTIDCASYNVTIQLADGTYTTPVSVVGRPNGLGSASLILQGNTTTPGNVKIITTSANAITVRGGARLNISGIDLGTTTGGDALSASDTGTYVYLDTGMRFAACAGKQIRASPGAAVEQGAAYTITGGGQTHWEINGGTFTKGASIDAGNMAFTSNFANAYNGGKIICNNTTFTNITGTGTKYYVYNQGLIQTYGAGTSIFPGTTAGYADTGTFGLYA